MEVGGLGWSIRDRLGVLQDPVRGWWEPGGAVTLRWTRDRMCGGVQRRARLVGLCSVTIGKYADWDT